MNNKKENAIGKLITDAHLEEICNSIADITIHGGFGNITLVFNKGQIEFIEHTIKQRFNLRKNNHKIRP